MVPLRSDKEKERVDPASGSVAEKLSNAELTGKFSFITNAEPAWMLLGGRLLLAVNEVTGAHAVPPELTALAVKK